MAGVLAGVRIVDFGRYIAGPFATAIMADMGAEVIRVEKLAGGEDRYIAPLEEGTGAGYLQSNRNKRGMTLNPLKPEGREIVKKLVATADVVSANLPPEPLAAMGLDYDSLRTVKPDIILTTTTAFGEGGPYSNRVGFDGIAQAMSGSVYLCGTPERPQRGIAAHVDFCTAMSGVAATLAAIMEHRSSGQGQHVKVDLLGTALTIMNPQLIEQAATGVDRVATGNRGQLSAPTDMYACRDGWVMLQVVGQPLFERWARMVGVEDWIEDPSFADDITRGRNGVRVSEHMASWCRDKTVREVMDACDEVRIPCGPVNSPQQCLDNEHVQAMGYLQAMTYPGVAASTPIARTPFQMSRSDVDIRRRAPLLGEHTDEIMGELGYGPDRIAALREKRVI